MHIGQGSQVEYRVYPAREVLCNFLHAKRTARLIGIAAEHANGGLRAYYYAIATMGWFYHPAAFVAATAWVLVILVRRDFFSRSRRLLLGREVASDGA